MKLDKNLVHDDSSVSLSLQLVVRGGKGEIEETRGLAGDWEGGEGKDRR